MRSYARQDRLITEASSVVRFVIDALVRTHAKDHLRMNARRRFSLEGEATIIRDYQNTLLIVLIELTYTLTPKLLIHRKYTGMTQTLDCVIHSCLG
jgi:hypothetical protein